MGRLNYARETLQNPVLVLPTRRIRRMTSPPAVPEARIGRYRVSVGLAAALTLPGLVTRLGGLHGPHVLEAFVFGLAIVGAAFLLSWAAEVAQLDISAGLAIAV